jgi:hypothetical protein
LPLPASGEIPELPAPEFDLLDDFGRMVAAAQTSSVLAAIGPSIEAAIVSHGASCLA